MARDAVAITDLTLDTAENTPAGTVIAPANGATIPAGGKTDNLLIRVTNTNAAEKDATIKAGSNPPAMRAGLGDLVIPVPATSGDVVIVIEGARFVQADGSISVDFETGMTGKISAIRL